MYSGTAQRRESVSRHGDVTKSLSEMITCHDGEDGKSLEYGGNRVGRSGAAPANQSGFYYFRLMGLV
jgi:hypothetical protein